MLRKKPRKTVTLTAENNWKLDLYLQDLPENANGQGNHLHRSWGTLPEGYELTDNSYLQERPIVVTKIWNNAENQDGKRPESITVSLLADGKETKDHYRKPRPDLPEKADGKAIEYTWTDAETLPKVTNLPTTARTEL